MRIRLRAMQGTQADYKNELLFSDFGINYAKLPEQYRKVSARETRHKETGAAGLQRLPVLLQPATRLPTSKCHADAAAPLAPQGSVVVRQKVKRTVEREGGVAVEKEVTEVVVLHCDIIRDAFWKEHPALLK